MQSGRFPGSGGPCGSGRILRLKQGYNPNSSSLGSIVFAVPAALVALPVLFAAAAGFLLSRVFRTPPKETPVPPAESEKPGVS